MNNLPVSSRIMKAWGATSLVADFFFRRIVWKQSHADGCDFASGDPQEMPPEGFVEASQKSAVPQNKDW